MTDPLNNNMTDSQQKLDLFFTWIYFVEMMLKISAMGFIFIKNSYLRDPWN